MLRWMYRLFSIVWSVLAIAALVYGELWRGSFLWVPTQLVLWVIDWALVAIYGCEGPRVPVNCP